MQEIMEPGLRERKRLATEKSIRSHALRLALDRGYENVTIEMICGMADVSRRTFFNYFPAKEAVILGPDIEGPDEDAIAWLHSRPSGDLVDDIVTVALASLAHAEPAEEFVGDKMRIAGATPSLFHSMLGRFGRLDDQLTAVVEEHFRRYPETRRLGESLDAAAEARTIVMLVNAALRHSMGSWLATGAPDRAELAHEAVRLFRLLDAAPAPGPGAGG